MSAVRLLGLGILVLSGCAESPPGQRPGEDRPNVLLVSIDTLRADHLGCYGYARETSPAIDRLAAEGCRFETVMSSTSWTLPAHAALFTGLPDSVHGADRSTRVLAAEHVTLAERLAAAGWRTAGFWSGPYLHPRFGVAQGFEEYESCAGFEVFRAGELRADLEARTERPPAGRARAHALSHRDVTSPRLLERSAAWLRAHAASADPRPFFLFVHFWDPHYDFVPPPPWDTRFDPDYTGPVDGRDLGTNPALQREGLPPRDLEHLIALYDGEIGWTDEHVGRLLAVLDELGLAADTLVALTADHGEEFFEHGRFGHRKTLHGEVLRVPLVVRWPGRVPAGRTVGALASLVDVAPTLLELAGLPPPPDVLGSSLAPLVTGSAPADAAGGGSARVALSELLRQRRGDELLALTTLDWKLVVEKEGRTLGLFDLRRDPGEQRDLAETDPRLRALAEERLAAARRALAELAERHAPAAGSGAGAGLPPELERQLRALGYLGAEDGGGDAADGR